MRKVRFVHRDLNRTENDDFKLNVQSRIANDECAMPIYNETSEIIGWILKPMYE